MDATDVRSLIETMRELGNDHSSVEAKRARGGPPSRLWETVSAFANNRGGVLLLGISERDDFAATGVDDPSAMEAYLGNLCANSMDPPVRAVIETVVVDGASIVVVEVPAMSRLDRPCFYKGEGPYGGSYFRVADGDRRLTNYEVGVLLADRGQPRDDERPVAEAVLANLDPDLTASYLRLLRREKPRLFQSGDDSEVLRLTKVLVPHSEGDRLVPSVAGILALGKYPQEFLPQVDLTFVVYPKAERGEPGPGGARFLDNASIDGPLSAVTDDAMARLRQRMAKRSVISGVARRDVYEYPEEAIREALVNALAHRDLSAAALGTQVQVEMFPDRLEVKNPGGLHGPVAVEDLPTAATSSARNATLYKMLEFVPLPDGSGAVCENRGSGIKAMIASLRAAGMSLPHFSDNIASFQVTFPKTTLLDERTVTWMANLGQTGLSDSQILAVARMHNGEVMKNASYRQETGVDSRVATAELRDLVDRGIITSEGQRGGATYQIAGTPTRPVVSPVREPTDPPLTDDLLTLARAFEVEAQEAQRQNASVPTVARPVWDALDSGALSRGELEARLGLQPHAVRYRLRQLLDLGLIERIGEMRSPHSRYSRTSARPE